jgi:hypothetical protein
VRRRATSVAAVCLTLAASSACAGTSSGAPARAPSPLSVRLSSTRAGARPVVLKLTVRTELQCGRLVGGTVAVRLPRGAHVPRSISRSAALIGGKPAAGVAIAGRTLTIAVPQPRGVICTVIGPGRAVVTLTRAAGLGNPARAGRYLYAVERRGVVLRTHVTIH